MGTPTTLRDAIVSWRVLQQLAAHPTLEVLYEAVRRGGLDAEPALLAHVARCGRCTRELGTLAECVAEAEAFDLALPRAAAAPLAAPVTLATECGRYAIGLYPRGGGEVLITVEARAPHGPALEGAVVTVPDGGGAVLLAAPLVLGRASGRIGGLGALDLSRLVVRAERRA
jgi:hypothetical protein